MPTCKIFTNGHIYTATNSFQDKECKFSNTLIVEDDKVLFVGDIHDAEIQNTLQKPDNEVIDLDNRVVVPGLIDAHTHLLYFGVYLSKLDISHCKSLSEIQGAISEHAQKHPDLPRLLCRGWYQPTTSGEARATDLDGLDPQNRPIYIEALNCHSTWCNTAAINELPGDKLKQASPSSIPRNPNGTPVGLFAEMAHITLVWTFHIQALSMDEKLAALDVAFAMYIEAGYTGVCDLAMDGPLWEVLRVYRDRKGGLPIHVAAYWLVMKGGTQIDLEERVDEAIAMYRDWNAAKDPAFCIVGIKLVADGVVDGCTAAISDPFPGHKGLVPPVWTVDEAAGVVKRVTDAGMQVAIHAIGDIAITLAIDAIEQGGGKGKRHRMEHVEFPSETDIQRMSELGIIASIQPGHSDPCLVQNYERMVGSRLWKRAFLYKDFVEGGNIIAIGTDAPSADHLPLPTLYKATTRKSTMDKSLTAQTNRDQAITLAQGMHAFTAAAAYARFAEDWVGSLAPGMRADFAVLEMDWESEKLLDGRTVQTWSGGKKVFQAE